MYPMRPIVGDRQDRPYDCDAAIDCIGTTDLLPTNYDPSNDFRALTHKL